MGSMRFMIPATEPSMSAGLAWEKKAEGFTATLTLGAWPQSREPSASRAAHFSCSSRRARSTSR